LVGLKSQSVQRVDTSATTPSKERLLFTELFYPRVTAIVLVDQSLRGTTMARKSSAPTFEKAIKTAILEAIEENRDLVQKIIEEAVEEAFMVQAIKAGKRTAKVPRTRVMAALAGRK